MTAPRPEPQVWRTAPRSPEQGRREAEGLRRLGPGCVRLRQVAPDGALLLDRVEPGTTLADDDLPDDEATRVLGEALHRLQVPAGPDVALPSVLQECRELTGDAVAVLRVLLADPSPPVVLHGDLHPRNLLRGPDGWVAVDPHGLVGDPGYDVGPLLLNGLTGDLGAQTAVRLAVLAEVLGQDPARLAAWGYVRARLSLAWSRADGTSPLDRVAEVAAELRSRA